MVQGDTDTAAPAATVQGLTEPQNGVAKQLAQVKRQEWGKTWGQIQSELAASKRAGWS